MATVEHADITASIAPHPDLFGSEDQDAPDVSLRTVIDHELDALLAAMHLGDDRTQDPGSAEKIKQ